MLRKSVIHRAWSEPALRTNLSRHERIWATPTAGRVGARSRTCERVRVAAGVAGR